MTARRTCERCGCWGSKGNRLITTRICGQYDKILCDPCAFARGALIKDMGARLAVHARSAGAIT